MPLNKASERLKSHRILPIPSNLQTHSLYEVSAVEAITIFIL